MSLKVLSSVIVVGAFAFALSCNSRDYNTRESNDTTAYVPPPRSEKKSEASEANMAPSTPVASDNEKTGVGKFQHVELTHPLDKKMVSAGKDIYDLKCAACHKLTDEKLVGPGWKGVTGRRTPEWIMNFVTNTDEMLEKNEAAKNLYETCLVKMPNQNLSDEDARAVLEFQRNNDGEK